MDELVFSFQTTRNNFRNMKMANFKNDQQIILPPLAIMGVGNRYNYLQLLSRTHISSS